MPNIRFFTQADNQPIARTAKAKEGAKPALLTGYVSAAGKLVLPSKTVRVIGNAGPCQAVRIGSPMRQRKLTVLYLIPTDEQDVEGFPVVTAAKSVAIDLG